MNLRYFSKFTCFSTLFLIFAGGMVTSTGSGLAVPDWPLSYGTFFPPMIGGVFYEHGHRMIASMVGLLTLILAIWLKLKEQHKWIRHLGYWALATVISQGILGGITVLFFLPTPISVMHATLAQTFFVLTIIIAYSLSNERLEADESTKGSHAKFLKITFYFIILVYLQLIFGAVMRHTGSGLAIPDFPKMGGQWIPKFDKDMLFFINDWQFEHNFNSVKLIQVIFHFVHRMGALFILLNVCFLTIYGLKYQYHQKNIIGTILLLDLLIFIQINLGITSVSTMRSPVITSLHVATGASILGVSVLLLLRAAPNSWHEFKQIILQ